MISLNTYISSTSQVLQQEILLFTWCYTLFLPLFLFDYSTFYFSPSKEAPFPFACLPPFIATFLALICIAILLRTRFSRIFFFTLSVSSPLLSWNSNFWGVFVLFKLSHMHSMQQRLGKNLIINVEVKIFNLLVCSGSFPWFQASLENYTWIIRAPCLG